MYYQIGTRYGACTLAITISSLKAFRLKLIAFDNSKPNTFFANRTEDMLSGETETFYVQMPICGNITYVGIFDDAAGDRPPGSEDSFKVVSIKNKNLKLHEGILPIARQKLWVFIDFAQRFCYNAGWLGANISGLCYASPNHQFKIVYLDQIRSESGAVIPTPARINKDTGIIEASREKMIPKTICGRMAIVMHEYAHLNENDDPESELEADLNGVEAVMSLGYPGEEILQSYDETFLSVPSEANTVRREHIEQFMRQYANYFYKH